MATRTPRSRTAKPAPTRKPAAKKTTRRKAPRAKATAAPPAPPPDKAQSLARLTAAFARTLASCFELHGDARLLPSQRDAFYDIGTIAVRVLDRFDGAWDVIVDGEIVATIDLETTRQPVDAANGMLDDTVAKPSAKRITAAIAAAATAVDAVSALLESLGLDDD